MKRLLAAIGLMSAVCVTGASAQSGVQIGTLECTMTDSRNLIVRSTQQFDCEFLHPSGEIETYNASMTRTGVDLTVRRHFVIAWAVLAPTEVARQPGALSGRYVGGTADVSLGIGVGASVLVGGGGNSFTLQPLSVAGVVGAGASLGVSNFVLEQ